MLKLGPFLVFILHESSPLTPDWGKTQGKQLAKRVRLGAVRWKQRWGTGWRSTLWWNDCFSFDRCSLFIFNYFRFFQWRRYHDLHSLIIFWLSLSHLLEIGARRVGSLAQAVRRGFNRTIVLLVASLMRGGGSWFLPPPEHPQTSVKGGLLFCPGVLLPSYSN